jgi:lipoate-protein ligase A
MRVQGISTAGIYDKISRALVCGLQELGAPVVIEKSQPHFPSIYRTISAATCFSSTGRYEIKCYGKKLVGSAQRRYANENGEEVVLQHGSILLGPDHKRIVEFMNIPFEDQRNTLYHELEDKTTELSTVLNRRVSFNEIAEVILFGFKKAWGIVPEVVNTSAIDIRVTA